MFDMKAMLAQVQKMQEEMKKVQADLKTKEVYSDAGGGMVKVKLNCANEILALDIAPELITNNDKQMLEDLVIAAINNGLKKVAEESANSMSGVGSMMPNIPGLNLNF